MASLRGWSEGVEVVDDGKRISKSELLEFEVSLKEIKALSREGSSASSSSLGSMHDITLHVGNGNGKSHQKSDQLPPKNPMPAGEGYQPNRLPSSIFRSKPAADWSIASNESLFSIHAGNNSFSRDQFSALYKSGELTKLDEKIITHGLPHPSELEKMDLENENVRKSSASAAKDMTKNAIVTLASNGEVAGKDQNQPKMAPPKEVQHPINSTPTTVDLGEVNGNQIQEKISLPKVHNSPTHSISGMSEGSHNSGLSFAFPVLACDTGRHSSVNEDQNRKGEKTPSTKQPAEEVPPQTPASPKNNGSSRSLFSWLFCCRS